MSLQILVIIIMILIYLIALLIFGILAINYSKRHRPMLEIRNQYLQEFIKIKNKYKNETILLPIELDQLPLPKGEKLFFLENKIFGFVIDKKTKEYKFFSKTNDENIDTYDEYYNDPEFSTLKNAYRLRIMNKAVDFKGMIYVTNKRILIENKNDYIQIPLQKIVKSYISIIPMGRDYFKGYLIHTKQNIYQIIGNDPKIVLIINQLLKNKNNF